MFGVLFRTPVAGNGGEFADHQAFDVRARCLLICLVGTVVADLGIREDDNLTGIRGISEDFLIAGDGGVEDHLSESVFLRTKALALEDRSVFQGENSLIQSGLPPVRSRRSVTIIEARFSIRFLVSSFWLRLGI